MAASSSSSPDYRWPIYDPNSFVITEDPSLYQNYKDIKDILGWLDDSQRNRFHLEEAMLKRKVCHNTINRTVKNPQRLIELLTPLVADYEDKYPGDKEMYDIIVDFEKFCDLGRVPNLLWLTRINQRLLQKIYNYYAFVRPADGKLSIEDLRLH